ncbi:MAG TPA: glycosyltransferase family 4 protein [Rhodocyclaceae bacterium]|nr:glycosyltransferase family 4 protein [Rhodocyclaceae bacterium]
MSAMQIAEFKRQLGFPEDCRIVAGIGTISWVKGSDLFVQLAKRLRHIARAENIRFVWFGRHGEEEKWQIEYDIMRSGIHDIICFAGERTDMQRLYPAFSVFTLTSRIDPFPLVMLEAGLAGLPAIGFVGAGGVQEYAQHGGAQLVPYLDLEAMAQQVVELVRDEARARAIGAAGRASVKAHFCTEQMAPKIASTLLSLAA